MNTTEPNFLQLGNGISNAEVLHFIGRSGTGIYTTWTINKM